MRIYPYQKEVNCIKCGSYATGKPVWHSLGSNFYMSMRWPLIHHCWGMVMDHLHMYCHSCGHSWAMACADIRDRETSK